MKQLGFMVLTTLIGTVGSFALAPVYGFAVYYLYAVLRPELIWDWALPQGGRWSFIVAVATMTATALWRTGLFVPFQAAAAPWYGEPKYTRTHYLFLAFVFWICLTYPTAVDPSFAYQPFVEYVKIFVMFVAATFALRTVRDLWVIHNVVALGTTYVAYEVNYQYLVNKWLMLSTRGAGGLDNNGAALMFAMAVPMCYFAWEATRHPLRWVFMACIPVLGHAVLLSFSRGAMLTLILIAFILFLRSHHKKFLFALYLAGAMGVVATAGPEVQKRFFSISEHDIDESAKSRKNTWGIALQMAKEKPIFGFGIRNSQLFTKAYGADMEGRAIHSQYLQTVADSGVPALALYLATIASTFAGLREVRKALRPWRDAETDKVRSMAGGLECGLAAFCFGAAFLSLEHFEMPYILMLLAVQLHAIVRAVAARVGPPVPVTSPSRFVPLPTPAAT